jgi:DNA (cytosine-5)-methyltransferase 1/DNA (cytosine-5)-methyltransferase 3A
MNVLSLFDGMSCGQIALNRAGFTVNNYYAAEIDKYAIKVTQSNFPNTIQLGDVTKWKDWDVDWSSIDLVTGGFPCQAWSLAGKQLGDKDSRGMLFWTMLDIIKTVLDANPKAKFLIENVKMKQEFEQYITQHTEQALGKVDKHLINSSLVSAQNRQRYYWTNIPNVTQPQDRKIYLKDIIECDVLGARIVGRRINDEGKRDDYNKELSIKQYLEINENPEKSNTLSTVQKDNVFVDREKSHCLDANYFKGGNLKSYFEKHRRQLVFSSQSNDMLKWRKLTPVECEKLQNVPTNYTSSVSNSQRYKMLGNGWTVDVIAHIFKGLKE